MQKVQCGATVAEVAAGGAYLCIFIRDRGDYYFLESDSRSGGDNHLPVLVPVDRFSSAEDNTLKIKKHFLRWYQFDPDVYISSNYYSMYPILDVKFYPAVCEVSPEEEGSVASTSQWRDANCALNRVSVTHMEMWRNENYFFDILLREVAGEDMGRVGR